MRPPLQHWPTPLPSVLIQMGSDAQKQPVFTH